MVRATHRNGSRGTADLPLHGGSAPRWLFDRMERLGGAISEAVIDEYGQEELLGRLGDPYWFQALGCVLGFDWHSSGLTTTTMGALKEALEIERHGVTVAGGKGATSRKTPEEIQRKGKDLKTSWLEEMKEVSRKSAAVDNSCVQDSFDLYHHTLAFSENGDWTVVQQGMNTSHARRYHWHSRELEDPVEEPQAAICSDERKEEALDLSSRTSRETRNVSVDLVNDGPGHIERYFRKAGQSSLSRFTGEKLEMPDHHRLSRHDLSPRSIKQLEKAQEIQPADFEELLSISGVGKKSLRALALVAEVVHGTESSWKDPAKYSYAHGGKDGTPFPVERDRYDDNIRRMREMLDASGIEKEEKKKAFRRLDKVTSDTCEP
ncbi:MAG: DUF763 domain-containing protein [Candidatus Nanohaloarchaea archaeon]